MRQPSVKRILCVCLGNICRSPAAEGVLQHRVSVRGLAEQFEIDSAGTSGFHVGEPADSRMRRAAQARGYTLTSRSRQFVVEDFDQFDLILAMDRSNLSEILSCARSEKHKRRTRLFSSYLPQGSREDVPDPYYGGPSGFEDVLDMLELGSDAVIESLLNNSKGTTC